MKPRSPSNRNASLEKAHRLLLAFTPDSPELGVMDLARRVGLNKSTVSRFVATLTQVGLLERVEGTKKIRLGLRVFELGMIAVEQHPLVQRAGPILERLSGQVRETVTLFAPVGDGVLALERRDGTSRLARPAPGERYPIPSTAAGMVMLSGDEARAIAAIGADGGSSCGAEIERVRAMGFASVAGDPEPELHSLASPVRDRTGAIVAAIGVTASRSRMPAAIPVLSAPLCRAAADLSRRLGFHRGDPPVRSVAEAPLGVSAKSA